MGRHQEILQVVGYQNSGKTTLMEKLIRRATAHQLKVASIKHHGHGGIPETNYTKDSARHEKAGACLTSVEGDGMLRLSIQQEEWELEDILAIYSRFPLDYVFIEGYKKADYPKVVLLQLEEDYKLLQSLSNIVCVLYWSTYTGEKHCDYPMFSMEEEEQYMTFLERKFKADDR